MKAFEKGWVNDEQILKMQYYQDDFCLDDSSN